MYKVQSPILFLIFNRPKESKLVFNAIKEAKPSKLYIAADGPRDGKTNDSILCNQTREIVKDINWDCEVKTLFRDKNLGCKVAVSNAISWFFENEPEGIILEDDCLPSVDFFKFTDEMLIYYRDNTKIAHICGCNFQDGIKRNEFSYYYSNITHVWGWAGWKRVWEKYDVNLNLLDDALKKDFLGVLTDSRKLKFFLESCYKKVKNGQINTWDFQYTFTNLNTQMLSIIPNNNMITNIGCNEAATHTVGDNILANIPFEELKLPIKHPDNLVISKEADDYTLNKEIPSLISIVKLFLMDTLKKCFNFQHRTVN